MSLNKNNILDPEVDWEDELFGQIQAALKAKLNEMLTSITTLEERPRIGDVYFRLKPETEEYSNTHGIVQIVIHVIDGEDIVHDVSTVNAGQSGFMTPQMLAKLNSALQASDLYNAVTGRLDYSKMPVTVLESMGTYGDGSTQAPTAEGAHYYASGEIKCIKNGEPASVGLPSPGILYYSNYSHKFYRYTGGQNPWAEVEIAGAGGSGGHEETDLNGKADLLEGTGQLRPDQMPSTVIANISYPADEDDDGDIVLDANGHLQYISGYDEDTMDPIYVDLDTPREDMVYTHKRTGKRYMWNGNGFDEVDDGIIRQAALRGYQSIMEGGQDKVLNMDGAKVLHMQQMVILRDIDGSTGQYSDGDVSYNPGTKKLRRHYTYSTGGQTTIRYEEFDPVPNALYYCSKDKKFYRYLSSSSRMAEVDINLPKKVSDLTNDAGYQTQEQVASAISQAAIEAVVGNGDFAITYDDEHDIFNIVRIVPTLQVTQLSSMSASTKSGTFKVSGTNLKGDVTIALPQGASNWLLSTGGGAGASSLTLSPTNGTLAETTITVTYSGSTDSVGNTITVSSTGAENKTVTANYTVVAGPTIFADTSKTIQAIAGDSATATIEVAASQLTEGITVIKGNDNANKFTVSPASLGTSGGTLTVQFSPASGDTANQSATITLRSEGAEDVVIALTGQVLVPSLSVSPATLNFNGKANAETAAQELTLTASNLLNDVTVSVPSGFTATPATIAKGTANGARISVKASGTATSGTLTISSGSLSRTVDLTWEEKIEEEVGAKIRQNHGYSSANTQSPDLWVEFTIKELADGNTHGKASANAVGEPWWSTDQNFVCDRLIIPESVLIGDHYYDVTALDDWGFNTKNFNIFSIPSTVTQVGGHTFNNDTIEVLRFPGVANVAPRCTIKSIDYSAEQSDLGGLLNASSPLTNGITLRKTDGVVSIGTGAFANVTGPITVYVPSGLIESYKSATNWSTYFNNGKVTFAAIQQ